MLALTSQVVLALARDELAEQMHRQRSEKRFRSLVQNSTDVVSVVHPDTTILYQSPAIERVLGYAPELLAGTKLSLLLHPEDRSRVLSELGPAAARPDAHPIECRLRHSDGSWRYFETYSTDLRHDPNVGVLVLNSRYYGWAIEVLPRARPWRRRSSSRTSSPT